MKNQTVAKERRPIAFGLALVVLLIWAACGPFFDYSQGWQLVVNTALKAASGTGRRARLRAAAT
jgi:low affinity Fe/Cu permease